MSSRDGMMPTLLAEIVRDSHRYAPGIEQRRATIVAGAGPGWRRAVTVTRERGRNMLERAASRAGFSHRHFDPQQAGERIARLWELADGLEATYSRLGDERSRRAMIDVLKLRVLGPYHAPLALTPEMYRAEQARADRELRTASATIEVSDPWFSPLSLYRVPLRGGSPVALHSHSVDIVSVFVLGQYAYAHDGQRVTVEPGDVVLDVGGCWGDTALYFASLVGPSGKVYTFEFDPESLEILRANLALNPELADRIEVVEKALWHRSGETLEIVQAGRCTSVIEGDDGANTARVQTITLDDFVEQTGVDRVSFVKMDVEGAECNVLQGARGSLARFAPKLAIAAYHRDDDLVTIPERIASGELDWRLYLGTFSAVEAETVLFARAARVSSSV
jgi:FkbM family methyltransferase